MNKKHLKIVKEFIVFLPILALFVYLGSLNFVFAAAVHVPEGVCGGSGFPCPSGETGVDITQNLVRKIANYVRLIIGAICILFIVISGVKLITAGGNEETFSKEMKSILFGLIGLFFIGLAGDLASVFSVDNGGYLQDPNTALAKSKQFSKTLNIVITFIKYIIGAFSVAFIVRNGLRLVLLGGNEEEVGKDKKNIFYGMLGLVFILLADTLVNRIFFKIDTTVYPGVEPVKASIDLHRLLLEMAGITNLVAAIAGPFALLSLVAGGVMYVFSAGEEEKTGKAKKIITWSLIGLIIIYGTFAVVTTFITRDFAGI